MFDFFKKDVPDVALSPYDHMTLAYNLYREARYALDSDDPEMSLMLMPKVYEAAIHLSNAAVDPDVTIISLDTDKPIGIDWLAGRICYLEGDMCIKIGARGDSPSASVDLFEQARDVTKVAVKYEPDNATYWLQLADAYRLLGDKENGTAAIQKAKQIDPSNIYVLKFISRFSGPWKPAFRRTIPIPHPLRSFAARFPSKSYKEYVRNRREKETHDLLEQTHRALYEARSQRR